VNKNTLTTTKFKVVSDITLYLCL